MKKLIRHGQGRSTWYSRGLNIEISGFNTSSAQALTFNESGDAGQTLGTVQNVGSSIDQINGNITTVLCG